MMASMGFVALSMIGVSASDSSLEDGLSLLQLQAASRMELESGEESKIHPVAATWPLKPKPSFGPDGTWATPFCKNILGCDPYCPAGCNGSAYWETNVGREPVPALAAKFGYDPNHKKPHFLACATPQRSAKAPGSPATLVSGFTGFINCVNSENSTKPNIWTDFFPMPELQSKIGASHAAPVWGDHSGYSNEFCPDDCVNDCAMFKLGGFTTCGRKNDGFEWQGYNGAGNTGPSPFCPEGQVAATGQTAWTWCGSTTTTTTTTTTTEPPTTTTTEPPTTTAAPVPTTTAGQDEASAVGDPHVKSATGAKFDLDK